MSTFAKVTVKGIKEKSSVYLVNPVVKNGFVSGKQVDKRGLLVGVKGPVLHIVELGEGRTVLPMKMNNFYAELEAA